MSEYEYFNQTPNGKSGGQASIRQAPASREAHKSQFFERLHENLGNQDPTEQERLVEEFRALIFGTDAGIKTP